VLPESAHTSLVVRRGTRRALRIVGPEVEYGRQPYQILSDFIRANIAWS
jgi:hypothetical protein